jgi:hypothetical protein
VLKLALRGRVVIGSGGSCDTTFLPIVALGGKRVWQLPAAGGRVVLNVSIVAG